MGNEHGYAVSSLKRLMNYKNAIDRLRAVVPDAMDDLLAGKLRLSLADTVVLSHRQADEIINVINSIADKRIKVVSIFPDRQNIADNHAKIRRQAKPEDVGAPKEQRWYRIGKQCLEERQPGMTRLCQTSHRIGLKYDYAESSVRMFADYAKAIDTLQVKAPEVVPDILADKYQLSLANTAALSRKNPEEIRRIIRFLSAPANNMKEIFPGVPKKPKAKKNARQTVKDVPAYDPDSHVIGLVYTIPSWISQIDSAFKTTDFGSITIKAHRRLINVLAELKEITETMLNIMTEEPSNEGKE